MEGCVYMSSIDDDLDMQKEICLLDDTSIAKWEPLDYNDAMDVIWTLMRRIKNYGDSE